MSTTFEVYPGNKYIPPFSELLCNTEKEVNNYLKSISVNKNIKLNVKLRSIKDNIDKSFKLTDKIIWDDSTYAWFYVCDISGGTDAYFYQHNNLDIEFIREELATNPNFKKYEKILNNNIKLGYKWYFRRSAGQPAIITLCYGFLAATLAKLTNGIVYSDDGAWDYKKFPANPDEFMQWYFRLEYISEQSDIDVDFVKDSLASIRRILDIK